MQASVKLLLLDLLRLGADRVQPSLVDFSRLVQVQDFLSNVEDLDVLHKWIRLIAERLNVPVECAWNRGAPPCGTGQPGVSLLA
jgi:hypothetical protein